MKKLEDIAKEVYQDYRDKLKVEAKRSIFKIVSLFFIVL